MKKERSESARSEKGAENKIASLERLRRLASNWANNTAQGIADLGDFAAALKRRCPLFKQLQPIVGDTDQMQSPFLTVMEQKKRLSLRWRTNHMLQTNWRFHPSQAAKKWKSSLQCANAMH